VTTEHDQGDYVLVHKSKAKISRARKMIIGVMAIGAVAAMTGAGTFASFNASTTNDATFKTGRIILSNAVNGGQTCFSSGTAAGQTSTSDAVLDENTTTCDLFFTGPIRPGDVATANVDLVNSSTYTNANLYARQPSSSSTCVTSSINDATFDAIGSGNLCGAVRIAIQEFSDAGFTTPLSSCAYPYNSAAACDVVNGVAGVKQTAMSSFPAGFASLPGANVPGTPNSNGNLGAFAASVTARHYQVQYYLPSNGFTATGFAADNQYQNLKAALTIKWLIQDAA
jgi:predicted ribosomally synthesized peptide with SipW-like signal peptide